MKKGLYIILAFTGIMNLYSCKDEVEIPGNPVINIQTSPADALFGDSLPFTIKATDADVPLSTEEFYKLKYCSTVVYMVPRA